MFLLLGVISGLICILLNKKDNEWLFKRLVDSSVGEALIITVIVVISLALLIDLKYFIGYCFYR